MSPVWSLFYLVRKAFRTIQRKDEVEWKLRCKVMQRQREEESGEGLNSGCWNKNLLWEFMHRVWFVAVGSDARQQNPQLEIMSPFFSLPSELTSGSNAPQIRSPSAIKQQRRRCYVALLLACWSNEWACVHIDWLQGNDKQPGCGACQCDGF